MKKKLKNGKIYNLIYLSPKNPHSSRNDNYWGYCDINNELPRYHRFFNISRWLLQDIVVNRFDTETKIHKNDIKLCILFKFTKKRIELDYNLVTATSINKWKVWASVNGAWILMGNYLWAGGPSIMMFIQSICIAFNGFGTCMKVDRATRDKAAILLQEILSTIINFFTDTRVYHILVFYTYRIPPHLRISQHAVQLEGHLVFKMFRSDPFQAC